MLDFASGCAPELRQPLRLLEQPDQGIRQGRGITRWHEMTGATVFDELGNTPDVAGDDRQAGGHGFHDRVRERFGSRGQGENIRLRQHCRDVVAMTEKLDLSSTPSSRASAARFSRHGPSPAMTNRVFGHLATISGIAEMRTSIRFSSRRHATTATRVGRLEYMPCREAGWVDPVGNHHDLLFIDLLETQAVSGGLRIGDHELRLGVGGPLQPLQPGGLDEAAPTADSQRHRRECAARQSKDVRVTTRRSGAPRSGVCDTTRRRRAAGAPCRVGGIHK